MTSTQTSGPRPRGREAVRVAVLDATRALVAERGPDGFSVRDIAARAGVNHALVHRHFGTKAEVLEQVLAEESRGVVEAIVASGVPTDGSGVVDGAVVDQVLDVLAERPTYWRALAHAVLESPDVAVPGTASTTELFASLWRESDPGRATDSAVAGATALGWLIFGAFMSEATGADPGDVRRGVAEQIARLTAPEQPPS
ncbi:TetR/AcrR family transcriptional regulator [Nocardioides sp.]|uniref:TetR/AcrR family transcriptional regulator n=1 Tax=Nocardioides sp. TaxID=35761 RepID=UPI0035634AED